MSARAVLELARQNGVHVAVEGTELILNSDHEPPLELLDQLRCHKAEIIAYIAPSNDGWAATAWRAFFEERLATAESDGGRPRAKAAAKAFDACVSKFTDRYPAPSKPGQCAYCGALEAPGCSVILPFGSYSTRGELTHTWLHRACWSSWKHVRRMRAVEALRGFGIEPQTKSQRALQHSSGSGSTPYHGRSGRRDGLAA